MLAAEGALLHSFMDAEGRMQHSLVDVEGNLLHTLHSSEHFLIDAEGNLVHGAGVAGQWLGHAEHEAVDWVAAMLARPAVLVSLGIGLLIVLVGIVNLVSLACCPPAQAEPRSLLSEGRSEARPEESRSLLADTAKSDGPLVEALSQTRGALDAFRKPKVHAISLHAISEGLNGRDMAELPSPPPTPLTRMQTVSRHQKRILRAQDVIEDSHISL